MDESVTSALLQEEIDAGFCYQYPGSVEDARAEWPTGLALGKLGVVRARGRKERLVLDNSICGSNANAWSLNASSCPPYAMSSSGPATAPGCPFFGYQECP